MDYEKKYKEALALARSYYDKDSMNAFLDTIFPELTDSEDETTRKEIISYLKSRVPVSEETELLYFKKWIAWLEKQKEQKPVAHENIFTSKPQSSAEILRHYLVWAENSEEDCPYSWKTLADAIMDGIKALKEQKPAEVDESIKRLNDNWMKKYFDDYQEQKPAEWSEEDEKMLNDCIMALSNWRDAVANYGHEVAPCQKLIDWLKSLRPSWKPNEEQMEALQTAVRVVRANNYPENAKILAELYEQLKAL